MLAVVTPPSEKLFSKIHDPAALRVLGTLSAVYPNSIPAKQLMIRAGFDFHSNPVTAFIQLCIAHPSLNQALLRHGWQAERSGGTPDDHYRLSPVGGG